MRLIDSNIDINTVYKKLNWFEFDNKDDFMIYENNFQLDKIVSFLYILNCVETWWGTMCNSLTVPATVSSFQKQVRVPPNIVRC